MEADYICNECKNYIPYSKPFGKEFPAKIKCMHCTSYNTRRVYSIKFINVPAGNCGNAQNGYTSKK